MKKEMKMCLISATLASLLSKCTSEAMMNHEVEKLESEVIALEEQIERYESILEDKNQYILNLQTKITAISSANKWFADEFILTAYDDCSECQGEWVGKTSTGATPTVNRTIAVDPQIIPYGSLVIIDGRVYVAEDCGGAIKGNRIDVFVGSHEEATKFGRQTKEVIVLLF